MGNSMFLFVLNTDKFDVENYTNKVNITVRNFLFPCYTYSVCLQKCCMSASKILCYSIIPINRWLTITFALDSVIFTYLQLFYLHIYIVPFLLLFLLTEIVIVKC